MGIKMLDDIIQKNGTPEQIEAYEKYCKKLDSAPPRGSFIICSKEFANALNETLNNNGKIV